MIYILPFCISFLTGFLLIRLLFSKETTLSYLTQIFLSLALGLCISGLIGWNCLWFFNQFYPIYVIGIHLFLLLGLIFLHIKNKSLFHIILKNPFSRQDYLILFIISVILLLIIIFSFSYPFGGWDAWAMWNVKAKFIFLGKTLWKNMFSPILIETNIDYPFLLPLINCWFWAFSGNTDFLAPRIVSITIPIIISGLLMSSIKTLNKTYFYIFAGLYIALIPEFSLSSVIQYSDQLLSLFLLIAFICLLFFNQTKNILFIILAGIFTGFLTFTKNEGLLLCLLITIFSTLWLWQSSQTFQAKKKYLFTLIGFIALAAIPWLLFKIFWCPQETRFINGFLSLESPTSLNRFVTVVIVFGQELIHPRWAGFWIIAFSMMILFFKTVFRKGIAYIPLVCLIYTITLLGIYSINTVFEVNWWLSTSLNRTLSIIVPSLILWLFSAIPEK